MSYCKVMLVGNLTRDPEVRHIPSGTAVANVGLATNKSVKKDDKYVDKTSFHDLVFWGRQAEVCGEWLQRGSQIFVEGELEYDEWEDKETGHKRRKAVINVREFKMLGKKGGGGNTTATTTTASNDVDIPDDDVPF